MIEAACAGNRRRDVVRYDAKNPVALKQLLGSGIKMLPFPKDVMEASYKTAQRVLR